MPTWKLTLEYDGTRYHGWQSQKNADRTVQGAVARAARELLGEDAVVGGAGRTDKGVHALAQIAHVKARRSLSAVTASRSGASLGVRRVRPGGRAGGGIGPGLSGTANSGVIVPGCG